MDTIKGYSPSLEATGNPAWSMAAQPPLACFCLGLQQGIGAAGPKLWSLQSVSLELWVAGEPLPPVTQRPETELELMKLHTFWSD